MGLCRLPLVECVNRGKVLHCIEQRQPLSPCPDEGLWVLARDPKEGGEHAQLQLAPPSDLLVRNGSGEEDALVLLVHLEALRLIETRDERWRLREARLREARREREKEARREMEMARAESRESERETAIEMEASRAREAS